MDVIRHKMANALQPKVRWIILWVMPSSELQPPTVQGKSSNFCACEFQNHQILGFL